jgi:hypothetical protein
MTATTSVSRRHEIVAAATRNLRRVHVPFIGSVMVPPPDRVAYYAGMGVLAAIGVIEWPLAAVISAGHALADQHMFASVRGLGEAVEAA